MAFTLAEVLITLGIIGVVAAMTMPIIVENVTELVNSSRQANIVNKITQATDRMKALGLLGSYSSTDAFVDELQKYLRIAKRCNASNIDECWPTKTVITSEGEEYEVRRAKTGKDLDVRSNTTNNVGLILADGSSLILTYNQDSMGMDESEPIIASTKSLPVGGGKSKEFAYTTNTTGAIDFVMDVNGARGPNSETIDNKMKDIRSFKAAKFSKGCAGVELRGIGCVLMIGANQRINTCNDNTWDSHGTSNRCCSRNYWAGAKKACADVGMELPSSSTLESIANRASEYSEIVLGRYYWSSSETSASRAYNVYISGNGNDVAVRDDKEIPNQVLCVED